MNNTNGRYLVTPIGLSFDELLLAAIVATKTENRGSKVIDQESGEEVPRNLLMKTVVDATPKPRTVTAQQNMGFAFESEFKILPLLFDYSADE